jgi:hypothetical protein
VPARFPVSTGKNCEALADPGVIEAGACTSVRTGTQAASRLKVGVVWSLTSCT